jgi:hypothetical protein
MWLDENRFAKSGQDAERAILCDTSKEQIIWCPFHISDPVWPEIKSNLDEDIRVLTDPLKSKFHKEEFLESCMFEQNRPYIEIQQR